MIIFIVKALRVNRWCLNKTIKTLLFTRRTSRRVIRKVHKINRKLENRKQKTRKRVKGKRK